MLSNSQKHFRSLILVDVVLVETAMETRSILVERVITKIIPVLQTINPTKKGKHHFASGHDMPNKEFTIYSRIARNVQKTSDIGF